MKKYLLRISIASLYLPFSVSASGENITDYDRFQLFADCSPMTIIVESLKQDATDVGLTKKQIETTVRSRFRAARIYNRDATEIAFYVNVNVVKSAANISISLIKPVIDTHTLQVQVTSTWTRGTLGLHGGNSSRILWTLSEEIDDFIDEYLRVNANACNK